MFRDRFRLFTVLGIQVGIDPSWILLALLITWSLATGYFPSVIDPLPIAMAWALGVAGALGLFASIILHELSHAVVAQRFKIPIRHITLFLFGGVAEMGREPPSPRAEFLMAVAGPIMSFALAGVFWGLAQLSPTPVPGSLFGYLALINGVLASFNLVPAFPLDGGRMLRAALWGWTGNYERATRIASQGGRVFGVFMIALGFFSLISGNVVSGLWTALIGFFVFAAAESTETQMRVATGLEDKSVRDLMTTPVVSIPADASLTEVIDDYFLRYHHTVFPVVREERLLGSLRLEDLGRVPVEERAIMFASALLPSARPVASVPPEMPALKALRLMQERRVGRLFIAEGDRLLGVVTLSDVTKYLAIQQLLGSGHRARR